jgi:hypothetical protein
VELPEERLDDPTTLGVGSEVRIMDSGEMGRTTDNEVPDSLVGRFGVVREIFDPGRYGSVYPLIEVAVKMAGGGMMPILFYPDELEVWTTGIP